MYVHCTYCKPENMLNFSMPWPEDLALRILCHLKKSDMNSFGEIFKRVGVFIHDESFL